MGRRTTVRTYGWTAHFNGDKIRTDLGLDSWIGQCRAIVGATSKTEVARIVGVDRPSQLFNLCETGNAKECDLGESNPGVIYIGGLTSYQKPYIIYNPREHGSLR